MSVDITNIGVHNIDAGSSQQELPNENVMNPTNDENDIQGIEYENPSSVPVTVNVGLEAQNQLVNQLTLIFNHLGNMI